MVRVSKRQLEVDKACLEDKLRRLQVDNLNLTKERDRFKRRVTVLQDGLMYLHQFHLFDAATLAQLGLATLVPAAKEGEKPTVLFQALDDLLTMTNDAMKDQATVAKFRLIKGQFIAHQAAVTAILDRINALGKKNVITTVDIMSLREIRSDLSAMIGREI